MIDRWDRKIDYIRISVTDRCNLRCIYCMPEEGVPSLPHEEILTYDEILRLCRCFLKLGINKVKITGGEPLVRKDIASLVGQMKTQVGMKNVTLTTNGLLLGKYLPDLVAAGLDGVNISLDTLNPSKYEKITRKDALNEVLSAIQDALNYQNLKVKINCVPVLDTDKEDIIEIAGLAKNSRLGVRFIEMMPIGLGKNYSYYSEEDIIAILKEAYGPLEPVDTVLGNGPAHYYSVSGFEGKIGFISAISHKFCNECNRVRLTSDGYLKTCLQYEHGTDLKAVLRGSKEDSFLQQMIEQTIYEKPVSHNFKGDNPQGTYELDGMSKIGG
ncbi:GTP 3',8-cyclase MoaA [Lacrimispora sp. 38-1]|uniref:GTP 3',8-cyclase MoaA n=1 Tax=Lacrimispora sp. 38-1 TaxID=3125778 RepID=UPI003CFB4F72